MKYVKVKRLEIGRWISKEEKIKECGVLFCKKEEGINKYIKCWWKVRWRLELIIGFSNVNFGDFEESCLRVRRI